MKKSLLALATLASFTGAAMAENSVTMYGRVDLSVGKPAGTASKGMFNGSGNRLGLKGVEELGNGVQAIFNIEHRFQGDNGAIDSTANPQRFWHARSIVGLQGGFGQFTLGREYTTTWTIVQSPADPWGADTVASNLGLLTGGGNFGIRTDSSATYLFNAGGFRLGGQIGEATDSVVGAAPGTPTTGYQNTPKKPWNVAAGFGLYGLNIGLGHERNGKSAAVQAQWTTANIGYDFKVARVNVFGGTGKTESDAKVRAMLIGAAAPLGAGEIRASYGELKIAGVKSKQAGLGYHHSLSKRTTVYADYVRKNTPTDKNGYDVGIKHNF